MNEERVTTVFPCGATSLVLRRAWERVQREGKVMLQVWDKRADKKLHPPTMPDGSPLRCTSGCFAPERAARSIIDENGDFIDDVWGECVCMLDPSGEKPSNPTAQAT